MLENLWAVTETAEFADDGGFRFVSLRADGDRMVMELCLVPGFGGAEQLWNIACHGVRDFRIGGEFTDRLSVEQEHPVLIPFTENRTALFYRGSAANPIEVVGALYEAHQRIVGGWLPFEQYLNMRTRLPEFLSPKSGKVAEGPVSLMHAYAEVLTARGIVTSMLEPYPARRQFDGRAVNGQWVVDTTPLFALVLQSSYVVAERFEASPGSADRG